MLLHVGSRQQYLTRSDLFRCRRLSAPFRSFDKYRTFGLQFLGQQTIHNPMFVTFHILIVYSGKGIKIFANSVIWHRNNREFGSCLFSKMAHSYSPHVYGLKK
jgi:hypothetical protein